MSLLDIENRVQRDRILCTYTIRNPNCYATQPLVRSFSRHHHYQRECVILVEVNDRAELRCDTGGHDKLLPASTVDDAAKQINVVAAHPHLNPDAQNCVRIVQSQSIV
jgi:hypothetical protein